MRRLAKRIASAVNARVRRPRAMALLVHPSVVLVLAASMALCTGALTGPDGCCERPLIVRAFSDADATHPAMLERSRADLHREALRPRAATLDGQRDARRRQASPTSATALSARTSS